MLFNILSRLGSIRLGLACYSISYLALAVSAKAWHAIERSYSISYHALDEFIYEFFARTRLGTPEFKVFHEIMSDIMNFGLFSWEKSY